MSAKSFQGNNSQNFSRFIKSVLDRLIATIALIILSPIILLVAIAIYIYMGSPIIFSQLRPGKERMNGIKRVIYSPMSNA